MLLTLLQQNLGASSAGTLYAVIGPNAGWTDPTAAEIKAGQLSGGGAATWAGSTTAPTVTTAPFDWPSDATGLSASTSYRIAFIWSDGSSDSNIAVGTFTSSTGTVTVALTGESVSAVGGSFALVATVGLSGAFATASAGNLSPGNVQTLTGASATVSAGTVSFAVSIPLVGSAVTAAAGTITYTTSSNVTVALSGSAVVASAGSLGLTNSRSLSGSAVTASAGSFSLGISLTPLKACLHLLVSFKFSKVWLCTLPSIFFRA